MGPKVKSAVVKTQKIPAKRRRTKKLHKELLAQIEFYLSEANLRHDPFLSEKVGETGMNDLGIKFFLSLPLIQEMKVTEKDIITVAEISQVLQLSEDRKSLRRRFPVSSPPKDLEESTLYIENLPRDSTTEWLKDFCHKIGEVRYVSLPRHKKSDQIKGFAFVEFSAPHEVDRACRALRGASQNFFPKRTERYLNRLKRLKLIKENTERACSTPSSKQPPSSDVTPLTAESCLLNKSFDSVVDFELTGQEADSDTPLTRNRKRRRSRGVCETSTCQRADEALSPQNPAKRRKSLPMTTEGRLQETKKYTAEAIVSLKTGKKSSKKVIFSVNKEDYTAKILSESSKNCENVDENELKTPYLNKTDKNNVLENSDDTTSHCDVSKIPSDAKIAIHAKESCNMGRHETAKESKNVKDAARNFTVDNQLQNTQSCDAEVVSKIGMKRRRSASEPFGMGEVGAGDGKRLKEELPDTNDLICESSLISDIDKMISQGRLQAKATEASVPPQATFKRPLQSVVAKPAIAQQSPKKPRRRRSRRKKTGREPVELRVMSKVDWSKLKNEYKSEQRRNMGILKKTLKENKEAGSVFIQKHLDVLHDVNVSNESIQFDENSTIQNNGIVKEHKLLKRGPPTFQPGVIVQVSAIEGDLAPGGDLQPRQLPTIEEIKLMLNNYGQGVAYVDVRGGDCKGFVRFNDGESAQRAIMEEKGLALCLLTGQHEEQYWDKLLVSKERKYARERPKIRGRTKILNRVEVLVEKAKRRHIRFDNDLVV